MCEILLAGSGSVKTLAEFSRPIGNQSNSWALTSSSLYHLKNPSSPAANTTVLGYLLGNEHAMLKRYSAESLANLDELRARAHEGEDIRYIKELPNDLPYSVDDMRKTFIEWHR